MKTVIDLAATLKDLVGKEAELGQIIAANADKAGRLNRERNLIAARISQIKAQLKTAAAAME